MNVTQETVGNVLVVGPEGKLNNNGAKDLESVLIKAMDGGAHRILFDFSSQCTYPVPDYVSSWPQPSGSRSKREGWRCAA